MNTNSIRKRYDLANLPRIAGGAPTTDEQIETLLGAALDTFTPETLATALAELTDEAVAELAPLLDTAYAAAREVADGERRTLAQLDAMEHLADMILAVRADESRRETEQATLDERAAAIDARVAEPAAEDDGDPDETGDADAEPEGDADAEPDVAPDAEPDTPAVEPEASAPAALPQAAATAPTPLNRAARRTPRPASQRASTPLARNMLSGRDFTTPEQIVQALTEAVNDGIGNDAVAAQRTRVARFSATPTEFAVTANDSATAAGRVIDAAVRFRAEQVAPQQAIVAAGGICAPATPLYDIPQIADTTSRPIRDSLARIAMPRGRVTYPVPRSIADLRDAITVWTLANDLAAATDPEVRKDCVRVDCPDFLTAEIQAIVRCLTFGNMNARAFEEDVANALELAAGAQAEAAELELLAAMAAVSMDVYATSEYGAARDALFYLELAAEESRDRFRMPSDARVEIWAPRNLRATLRGDIARQMPGDGLEALNVSNAQLDSWLAQRNISATWHLDAGHIAAQPSGGIISPYPFAVSVIMAHPGAHAFGDGSTLDLGVQRSPELNESNDFQVFAETFEAHAYRGLWSKNLHLDLCPNGTAAGLTEPVACAS